MSTERFTATVFTAFLDRVPSQAGRKVHVVADRHPVHRGKAVRVRLEANADLKRNVNASRAHNVDRLAHETRRFLHRRQRRPHIVRGYFQAPHVCYAIM